MLQREITDDSPSLLPNPSNYAIINNNATSVVWRGKLFICSAIRQSIFLRRHTMLHHGLYEQVINHQLNSELAEIPEARKAVAPIDKAEASKVLAQYLTDVVQKGLDNVAHDEY